MHKLYHHRMPYTFVVDRAHHTLCNMSLFFDRHRRKILHTLLLYGEHEDFHSISWIVYQLLTATAAFVANAMNVNCLFTCRYIYVRSVRMRFTISKNKKYARTAWAAFRYYVYASIVHRCMYAVQAILLHYSLFAHFFSLLFLLICCLWRRRCCCCCFCCVFPLCFVSDIIRALCDISNIATFILQDWCSANFVCIRSA